MQQIKIVSVDAIRPYEKNPRNNAAAVDKVAASLCEFGWQQPISVDKDGVIICGHTRYKAALSLGMTDVPVVYATDLTPEQAKAYRLADNKTGEIATWDADLLAGELVELQAFNFNMEQFGFEDLNQKKELKEDDFDVDAAYGAIVKPVTKRGDIWLLGRHRLLCGDSTSIDDVNTLMDGKLADMIFTDPPYNVDIGSKLAFLNNGGRNNLTDTRRAIKNDNMSDADFAIFMRAVYDTMFTAVKEGGALYVCHSDSMGHIFRGALLDAGFLLKQCIIWVKNSLVISRSDHHWQHEPILYGWKPGASHHWYGGRKQTTVIRPSDGVYVTPVDGGYQIAINNGVSNLILIVPSYEVAANNDSDDTTIWYIDRPTKSGDHPTMKPIKLCGRAILNSSKAGQIAFDPFGGSGSTLMAAEQIDRICYLMELDEKFCDVIVRRWEEYTGLKAEHISK